MMIIDVGELLQLGMSIFRWVYKILIGWALSMIKKGYWFFAPAYYCLVFYIVALIEDDMTWQKPALIISTIFGIICFILKQYRTFQMKKAPDYKMLDDFKEKFETIKGIFKKADNVHTKIKKSAKKEEELDKFKGSTELINKEKQGVFYLGKQDGRDCYINIEDKKNCGVLLVGSTGSGKSATCVANNLILAKNNLLVPLGTDQKKQHILCVDVKPELEEKYYTPSHPGSKIVIFSPKDLKNGWHFDPLYDIRTSDNPTAAANLLAGQIIPMSGGSNSAYFETSARNLLASAFLYYCNPDTETDIPKSEVSFSKILEKVNLTQPKEFAEMVNESKCTEAKVLCNALLGVKDSEAGSIYSSLKNHCSVFTSDKYLVHCLGKGEPERTFTASDIDKVDAIFIKINITDISTIYSSITGIVVGQILSYLCQREEDGMIGKDGKVVKNDIVSIFLDEFPVYGKFCNASASGTPDGIGQIENSLATLRSKSVCPILISVQGLKQLNRVMGDNAAAACIDNCISFVYGANDTNTQKYIADRIGKFDKRMQSTSISQQNIDLIKANASVSVSLQERYRIRPEDLAWLPSRETPYNMGVGVLIYNEGVCTIDKVPAFKDRNTGRYYDEKFNLEKYGANITIDEDISNSPYEYDSGNDIIETDTRCPICGALVEEGDAFCGECGNKLS